MQEGVGEPSVEVYKAYIEDANQLRASRQAENSLRVTIVTLFLGAQAFIASTYLFDPRGSNLADGSFVTWLPFLAISAIGFVGIRFCRNWRKLITDLTTSINAKFTNLRQMEEQSAFLQSAGATLFMNEYQQRHPEYIPPPLPESGALIPTIPKHDHTPRRPVKGAGLSALRLEDFFSQVFWVVSLGAVLVKALGVAGVFQWLAQLLR